VFLKSLTLRGFKSFADKTTLEFEPGITVIVGPNGSGKSNVVDAIAWVLGEQGAKSLRGGRMEDVIFAGTGSRGPLGRAEVTLTIDNSAGLLPIEYGEVTMTRLLYRSGDSEYALNGTPCRLLDLQELLSDTGVGRELHTILGQNRLEDVLHGRPEDRRAAIEEAAGVYKHRKRKEKALRKLAGMEQHLVRLTDLVGELRRQLRPLQQQAETAAKAAEVAAELREVRLVLRARELDGARRKAAALDAEEAAFSARLAELEAAHQTCLEEEARLGTQVERHEPLGAAAGETVHRLVTVRERLRGTMALAEAQARHLADALAEEPQGRSVVDLEREAAEVAAELTGIEQERERATAAAEAAVARRDRARAAVDAHDRAVAVAERERAGAHRREVRLTGEAAAARRTVEQLDADAARVREHAAELERRGAALAAQLDGLRAERAALDADRAARATARRAAEEARDRQAAETRRLAAEERRLEGQRAAAQARREAFEATARAAGGDALAFLAGAGRDGILGPLSPACEVQPGYEAAVAAALGPDADALVVDAPATATDAAGLLRDAGGGRAILLHPDPEVAPPLNGQVAAGRAPLLLDRVRTAGPAGEVARRVLAGVLVAEDLGAARALLARFPDRRVVTRAGELVAAGRVEGGVVPEASGLAARRAAKEAAAQERAAAAGLERAAAELRAAEEALDRLATDAEAAARAHQDAQAALRRLDDRLGLAGRERRAFDQEAAAAAERLHELTGGRHRAAARLTEAEAALAGLGADARAAPAPELAGRAPLAAELDLQEQAATSSQVAAAGVAERARLLGERLAELRAQAEAEAEAAERRARVRAARRDGAARAAEAARLAGGVLERLERCLAAATAERDRLAETVQAARAALAATAGRRRDAAAALDEHHTAARAGDEARIEARLRAEELGKRIVEEFALDPDEALADYLPTEQRLAELAENDPRRQPSTELRRAATALERRLTLLGRVNPLALEEFKALEERFTFLSGQLQDLKDSRRDLLKVIRAIDERVREVFGQAFGDVAREFDRTFRLLFPGGEGRLVLTEPEDMLNTGVEVEARPPGKKVKRLQLLSGGERSLVALAFCFAVFRARPSPFYVLDEVEAALDDVNLHRFLDLLEDARERAQLLVVSHQRRTMEAADALYGVSMQSDGVTKVVSQRLRTADGNLERQPVAAAEVR
jgi:chromosome segregation protein